jgi:hypothetical protein
MIKPQHTNGIGGFRSATDAITSLKREGFDWRLVRQYFRFADDWLSEGEYAQLLWACLQEVGTSHGKNTLLDMLDLQNSVFLEQVALQERMLGCSSDENQDVAFGERVMTYLTINHGYRPDVRSHRPCARTVLLNTEPGELINKLLGTPEDDVY